MRRKKELERFACFGYMLCVALTMVPALETIAMASGGIVFHESCFSSCWFSHFSLTIAFFLFLLFLVL